MQERIDLAGLPRTEVSSVVSGVRKRISENGEFLVWSLPIHKDSFRTINESKTTPLKGGNGDNIDISDVVEATFDVYTLPKGSEYPEMWFVQSVKRHDGTTTVYEYEQQEVEL